MGEEMQAAVLFPYSVSCVLLAYNEADNLRLLLPEIHKQLQENVGDYEILVIDSAAPLDDTQMVCEQFGAVYINQELPYFGGALKTAIKYANNQFFLILDADCSCNPESIPALFDCMSNESCDMVIGSRYTAGGISNGTKIEKAMSRFLNGAFSKAIDVDARDISIDYRLYRTEDLKKLKLYGEYYDIVEEVILKLKLQKEAVENKGQFIIKETPIEFEKRVHGSSKRQLVKFIMSYLKTLVKLWALRLLCARGNKDWRDEESKAELISNAALYIIIGCLGAVIDFAVFSLVLLITGWDAPDTVFQFVGIAELANVAGALAGSIFCFRLNAFYNFLARDHLFVRYLSYAMVVFLGTCFATFIMLALRQYMSIYVVKALCVGLAAILQFFLNRMITFRKRESE